MTSSIELAYFMRFHTNFIGVFSLDTIPSSKSGCFILNTDTSNLSGKHWIAINITKHFTIYFDPMGWIPIRQVLQKLKKPIKMYGYNFIQNPLDLYCGQHCVYFLYNGIHADSDLDAQNFINKYLK